MPLSSAEQKELNRLANQTGRSAAQTKRMRELITKRGQAAKVTATPTTANDSRAKVVNRSATPGPGYNLREYEAKALEPTPGVGFAMDPKVLQQLLRDAGYYTGRIDGIIGPLTNKAIDKWVADGSPDLEAKAAERAAAGEPIGGLGTPLGGGGGGAGSGSAPVAVSGSAASLSPQAFRTRVLAELPAYAAFLDIPELVPIIQARLDDTISTQEFAARVKQTGWYRSTPEKTRAWMGLYAIDPATAERQIDEDAAKLKQRAADYLVPMADVTAREWAKKSLSGEIPETGVEDYLRGQAKSLFPALAAAIDAGITVAQYADPYRQIAAQTLELPPEAINFGDVKWSRALQQVGDGGARTSMTLYDWQNLLRTDPTYGYDRTTQARSQAAQIAESINQTFGKVA